MAKQEANIEQIVETLSHLTVLDLSNLKKALEEKWGVKAVSGGGMPMMMPAAMPAAGAAGAEQAEEATEFQVMLAEAPADKKIAIIKVVREATGLGLKEAKDLVENPPKPIKDKANKAEAEEIKKKVTEAGGKVTLKGL